MPLSRTDKLIDLYSNKLKNGTISDQQLINLADIKNFPRSNGYVDPNKPITDNNHNVMDAIKDFVFAIGPVIETLQTLHNLTARLIELSPKEERNTFMRRSTLEKAFLAYEMVKSPVLAELHFASPRLTTEFPGPNDIPNLKAIILKPLVDFFAKVNSPELTEPHFGSSRLTTEELNNNKIEKPLQPSINISDEEKVAYDLRLKKLVILCSKYKTHLESSVGTDNLHASPLETLSAPSSNIDLANKKYNIVSQMLRKLNDKNADSKTRIQNMELILSDTNKNTLKDRRDSSSGIRFLESVLNVLSFGIYSKITKDTFAFWKSHGQALVEKINENQKELPKM